MKLGIVVENIQMQESLVLSVLDFVRNPRNLMDFLQRSFESCRACYEEFKYYISVSFFRPPRVSAVRIISTCGREIFLDLAVLLKYLPTMKLRASRCAPGMRVSWP